MRKQYSGRCRSPVRGKHPMNRFRITATELSRRSFLAGSAAGLGLLSCGPNGANREPFPGPASAFLGADQIRWLKQELLVSKEIWKWIAQDKPTGTRATKRNSGR